MLQQLVDVVWLFLPHSLEFEEGDEIVDYSATFDLFYLKTLALDQAGIVTIDFNFKLKNYRWT